MVDKWTVPKVVGGWVLRHPWESFGIYVALKNPYTRAWMLDHLLLAGRGALAGTRGSWGITAKRLVKPAGRAALAGLTGPTAQTAAIVAAPVVIAAVVAAGITAAQQRVGLVGPDAPKMGMGGWMGEKYRDLQLNPFMISMGSVV